MTIKKQIKEIKTKQAKHQKREKDEYTIFNAVRDNNGKGIDAEDLLKILKKTL